MIATCVSITWPMGVQWDACPSTMSILDRQLVDVCETVAEVLDLHTKAPDGKPLEGHAMVSVLLSYQIKSTQLGCTCERIGS